MKRSPAVLRETGREPECVAVYPDATTTYDALRMYARELGELHPDIRSSSWGPRLFLEGKVFRGTFR